MSFIKIYKKDWSTLTPPNKGSLYVGYDIGNNYGYDSDVLLQMDENGVVTPINSGNTMGGGGLNGFVPHSGVKYNNLTDKYLQTIYNTNLDTSLTTPNDVGGIKHGTSVMELSGKTIVQILDDMLFETMLPTYTIPTIHLISSESGNREIGININVLLSITGIKNDSGHFIKMDFLRNNSVIYSTSSLNVNQVSDISPQFGYPDPNNPNYSYSVSYNDNITVSSILTSGHYSITTYNSIGDYNSGLVKKDNKGVNDSRPYQVRQTDAPQLNSNNYHSNNINIIGYYPYFYGKTSNQSTATEIVTIIESGSNFNKIVNNSDNTLIMNFNCVGEWPWFAIFDQYDNKNHWYENALNNGNIGTSVTDLFSSGITKSINSFDGYWNGINFKIYISQKVTTIGNCEIRE